MTDRMELENLLAGNEDPLSRTRLFAILTLGIVESLTSGTLSANDAVRMYFHGDNCLYARKKLRNKIIDEVMSRGVQLPDLFAAIASDEAHREFQHELAKIHALCLQMLERVRQAA